MAHTLTVHSYSQDSLLPIKLSTNIGFSSTYETQALTYDKMIQDIK